MLSNPEAPKMRAAVHAGIRSLEMVEVDRPSVLPGTALVRVAVAGVCGSDLHGYHSQAERQTRQDGHELSGVVVKVGEGVANVRVGDRVAADILTIGRGCGTCHYCRSGNHLHCEGARVPCTGAFAEYTLAGAAGCFHLPEGLDHSLGALVEPVAVGVHAVRFARIEPSDSVTIIGGGTIGLCTLLAARWIGCERVFVAARHPFQAEAARRLGAAAVLPAEAKATTEAVRSLTDGRGADHVVEAVGGGGDTIDLAVQLARRQGRVAILGLFTHGPVAVNAMEALERELTVTFPLCYSVIDGRHDFEVAIDLIAAWPALARSLITHEFPLDDVATAFATAADKRSGAIKVQVRP